MILEPGTFKVSTYRKTIPVGVKIDVILRTIRGYFTAHDALPAVALVVPSSIRFDHRPPLETRKYDTEAGDFIPPQNDPEHIEAIPSDEHDFRTFGRKPGAEKTVTTRGSDLGEAARTKRVAESNARHKAVLAAKIGLESENMDVVRDALAPVAKRPWPKRAIQNRPFNSKGKRRFAR